MTAESEPRQRRGLTIEARISLTLLHHRGVKMRPILACIVPLTLVACSSSGPSQETAGQDAGSGVKADLRHTFPAIDIEPGQEITALCQSWTIGNDQPLYLNSV